MYLDGYNGDCSETYAVGEVDRQGRRLLDAARRCRDEAIALCRPGVPFSDIGETRPHSSLEEALPSPLLSYLAL